MFCPLLRLSCIGLLAPALCAATAVIDIDASKAGPRIHPNFYGIFLEEINHGVDGGLYAELVRNRAFEDATPPEGCVFKQGRWVDGSGPDGMGWDAGFSHDTNGLPYWSLVQEGSAKGSVKLSFEKPLSSASPRSLEWRIETVAGGRLAIANEGYWGIAASEEDRYKLSFYARCADGFAGSIRVTLEDSSAQPCTTPVEVKGLGLDWKKFQATLIATRTDPKCRLVLSASSPGTVWLDFVSLFPAKTWKNRPNGLRADLAQMIADLQPRFVRFPGGCEVEGGTIETAYNWKDTVGPLEQRKEKWSAWNYRHTHGMGFLEYLQFCEDLGAEPLHVGFAGQSCLFRHSENLPMPEMGWVLTNFVDAIEYANGSTATPWGKARARDGRKKPFQLKMVEIGNENGGKEFAERYQYIHPVLKARYPDISYIADLSWISRDLMKGCQFDIEDNHYYNTPQWFLANADMYAKRDRQLPPVYLGEVAVTSEEGGPDKGNIYSALGEGAYLMGQERNADVVKMVSYAPLLAHVNGRSGWHGMIYFDSTHSYGTVSYHLWRLFGSNRPDYTVSTLVDFQAPPVPPICGSIGLGTWDTSAEFKDLRVERDGKVIYEANLGTKPQGWTEESGSWSAEDGAWRQKDSVVGIAHLMDRDWTDYTVKVKARKLKGPEGFLVSFGRKGTDQYWWNLGGWGNREHGVEFNRSAVGQRVAGTIEANRWYDIQIELRGSRILCSLDGKLIHDVSAPSSEKFLASAGLHEASGDVVVRVINTSRRPVQGSINLAGTGKLDSEVRLTVLRSDRLDDNNSMAEPYRIVPLSSRRLIPSARFTHEFAPYSFTLLRVKAELSKRK